MTNTAVPPFFPQESAISLNPVKFYAPAVVPRLLPITVVISESRRIGHSFFLPIIGYFTNKKKILPNVILAIKNIAICILVKFDNYRYLQYWSI